MASGKAVSTVLRRPYRSMPTPMNSCVTPNDRPNSPAKAPSDSADSPKSVRSPSAMMEVTVRKAWLSEKADSKVSSMAQSRVDEGAAGRPVGEGVGGTGMAESERNKPGPEGAGPIGVANITLDTPLSSLAVRLYCLRLDASSQPLTFGLLGDVSAS